MKIYERIIGKRTSIWLIALILPGIFWLGSLPALQSGVHAQQPTVNVPTVTSSPMGSYVIVNTDQEQINVRSGPDTAYPIVGVLIMEQQVPALGRSAGGGWIMISYPGVMGGTAWVYAPLVTVYGILPIVEPPPTPTPATTPTIDQTLAAQFIIEIPSARFPTLCATVKYPHLRLPARDHQRARVAHGAGHCRYWDRWLIRFDDFVLQRPVVNQKDAAVCDALFIAYC
jgi:hypothetical protein